MWQNYRDGCDKSIQIDLKRLYEPMGKTLQIDGKRLYKWFW